jgi:hypothetical protein
MRPTIAPGLMATVVEQAPARLVRKLDEAPRVAEGWAWRLDGAVWTIATDRDERVTLKSAALSTLNEVGCSCLLSPKCLHLLAVLSVLEITEAQSGSPEASDPVEAETAASSAVELTAAQRSAAERLYKVAAEALSAGVDALGAVRQAELLRAVHTCRAEGLHRAASAGVRVVRGARDLHAGHAAFRLVELVDDLHDLVSTSAALRAPAASAALVGTARRVYAPVSGLRLYGLFCEPIVATSGHAGAVTWLCDATGALHRVGSVRPGPPTQAATAYRRTVDFGGVTLPHRTLCREGLFVQSATRSTDGRLGGGREASAAPGGPSTWDEAPLSHLWERPLPAQLDAAFQALSQPEEERTPGADLLFVTATVLGADTALRVALGGLEVACIAPSDHPDLCYRDALRRLAGAPDLSVRAIVRLVPDAPLPTVELLAFGPTDERLRPPAEWAGRVNAGLDVLQGAHLQAGPPVAFDPPAAPPDPTEALRRRLGQLALGGRAALPAAATAELAREALRLEKRMMPTGAALLRALAVAAHRTPRDLSGARAAFEPAELAGVFADAVHWERAAARHLRRAAWTVAGVREPHGT